MLAAVASQLPSSQAFSRPSLGGLITLLGRFSVTGQVGQRLGSL